MNSNSATDPGLQFMRMALEKAWDGVKKGQSPFAACLVKSDRVICCEHNVVWAETDSTMHAEVHAIRVAEKLLGTIDLSGCTIFSTPEPCPMCFSAIHWARIDRIVFGNSISDAHRLGFSELPISNQSMKQMGRSPVQIVGGILREECNQLFSEWAKGNGRVY